MKKKFVFEKYQSHKILGRGSYGNVYLVNHQDQPAALKAIDKKKVQDKPFLKRYIETQIQLMKKINHPNVVKIYRDFESKSSQLADQFICILMEYCNQGTLLNIQSKQEKKVFKVQTAKHIIVDILAGLKQVHKAGYIHRDIKLDNILVKQQNGEKIFKISDFGFSKDITIDYGKTKLGTEKYMAPEILEGQKYCHSVDIWAIGILFFFMLNAEYPFNGNNILAQFRQLCIPQFNYRKAVQQTKLKNFDSLSEEVQDFFRKTFILDRNRRISFNKIREHELFKEIIQKSETPDQFKTTKSLYSKIQKMTNVTNQYEQEISKMQSIFFEQLPIIKQSILKQFNRILFIKDSIEFIENSMSKFLDYQSIVGVKYYLLRCAVFLISNLLHSILQMQMPKYCQQFSFEEMKQFSRSREFKLMRNQLDKEFKFMIQQFKAAYSQVKLLFEEQKLNKFQCFQKKMTIEVLQSEFEQFKTQISSNKNS